MKLWSQNLIDGARIPSEFAFCVIDRANPAGHITMSANRNPHLAWEEVPAGTQSFALICHDRDVPSCGDDVNRDGCEIPAYLPRIDFFHWTLVDIPAAQREIAAGSQADGIVARGKPGPQAWGGMRHGINDYTGWFAGDRDMAGDYYGYDGPCPPWNDSIVHHYIFTLHALDVSRLALEGRFTGQQVREAISGHVLAQASITGSYTLNPRLA